MSEQAAARQAHCAAGLCFASSRPSTSCSVMLTVIESKQAAASQGRMRGRVCAFKGSRLLQFGWALLLLLCSGPDCSRGGFRVRWREGLCCAPGTISSDLPCERALQQEAIWSLFILCSMLRSLVSGDGWCAHFTKVCVIVFVSICCVRSWALSTTLHLQAQQVVLCRPPCYTS